MRLFIAIMAVLALSGRVEADMVSDLQKKELILLVNTINNAAGRKDAALIAAQMPERLYREMAARMNMSEQMLRAGLQQSVAGQFAHLAAHGYRLDSSNIHYATARSGVFYALVPTRVETDKTVTEFMTLAIYDNTKWHLIYGGQKTVQNPVFIEIYPYAADIAMPAAKITAK